MKFKNIIFALADSWNDITEATLKKSWNDILPKPAPVAPEPEVTSTSGTQTSTSPNERQKTKHSQSVLSYQMCRLLQRFNVTTNLIARNPRMTNLLLLQYTPPQKHDSISKNRSR